MTESNGNPFDFSALEVRNKQERFDLPWLRGDAYLVVRPANDTNKGYQSGVLRLSGKRRRLQTNKISAAEADRDRADDLKLYPKHVVLGWGGVVDQEGNEVEFSEESCAQFLAALPSWIFDKVRVFCMRAENFIDDDEDLPDPVELAGN
jgi:hypothetical protein